MENNIDEINHIYNKFHGNVDMNYQFTPDQPYTATLNGEDFAPRSKAYGVVKEEPGFIQTAKAEWYNFNSTAQGVHGQYEAFSEVDPRDDTPPEGWNAKDSAQNFVNVRPENFAYLLEATGPKDQAQRYRKVMEQQDQADTLANGSFLAKVMGGFAGVATDPLSYIPLVGWSKYGKLAPSFYKSMAANAPGVAGWAAISSSFEMQDKLNQDMGDFLKDTFTKTAFALPIFGVGGAAGHIVEQMGLWQARDAAKATIDGVDFKFATNEEGKITGLTAVDTTGNLNAAKMKYYQDMADSSFAKTGFFRIPELVGSVPYIKEGIEKIKSVPGVEATSEFIGMTASKFNEYFGSNLYSLLNSPFKTVRGFVDKVADHSILTQGILKGIAAPIKFSTLMQQTSAKFRALSAQIDGLHLERNGFDIKNRVFRSLTEKALYIKNKGLEVLGQDLDKSGYISKDDFYQEIENVLINENKSEHNAVNEAANMLREHMDTTWKEFLAAFNKTKGFLPPKTAAGYLMRVYDTPYLNNNKAAWTDVISNYLKESDELITQKMEPIKALQQEIKNFSKKHTEAVEILARYRKEGLPKKKTVPPKGIESGVTFSEGVQLETDTGLEKGSKAYQLDAMKRRLKLMKEALQNELKENKDLQLHVENWDALSAKEGKELSRLLKPLNKADKEIAKLKEEISALGFEKFKTEQKAKNQKTVGAAIPKAEQYAAVKAEHEALKTKLADLQRKRDEIYDGLQDKAHTGQINSRFFKKAPDADIYHFKNPNDRLKFRNPYETHAHRIAHANAYYDTIMHQTPEQTINQIMGRVLGGESGTPVHARSILVPDQLLYDNKFMSKDLMAKVANYTFFLGRRTHIKNVFPSMTLENGIASYAAELASEHADKRKLLETRKADLKAKLENPDLTAAQKKSLTTSLKRTEKEFTKSRKEFDKAKDAMSFLYDKMIGNRRYSQGAETARSVIMALTSIANLPFVPFTMLNDLGALGLQHGTWNFIRDGLTPMLHSLNGMVKTQDSESFRKTAAAVHLGLQDVLNGYADRNWGMYTNPYLNKGRIVHAIEKIAHFNANFTGTNLIDNVLQQMTGAVVQSKFMSILEDFSKGKMSKKDGIYLLTYGIDPKQWSERMLAAWKETGAGKTKLGGYQSNFWEWRDMEASNEFSRAVFRGIKDTQIQAGIADSPFWTDSPLGSIIKGFQGWMFASLNRYLIPTMQQPTAEKTLGVVVMLGLGALVDPMRRMARGEKAMPDDMDEKIFAYAAFNNSGIFSSLATYLSDVNLFTNGKLLGDLRSDKYKDRARTGLLGPSFGTANRLVDILDAAASGEWNKATLNQAVRMMPIANSSWTYGISKSIVDGLDIPENRRQAKALKNAGE